MKMLITQEELKLLKSRDNVKCECENCGLPFYSPKNVVLRAIKGNRVLNRFCSNSCRILSRKKVRIKKTCLVCNKEFEAKKAYAKYCSHKCANIHCGDIRRKLPKIENCLFCGKKLEHWGTRYCSYACPHKHKEQQNISLWKDEKISGLTSDGFMPKFVENYIWEKFCFKCAECGWNEKNPINNKSPLHIHHIDGDSKNNKEENLILLCPNCHSLTPNFGRFNKNGTRDKRWIYR